MNGQDFLFLLNFLINHYDALIVTTVVGVAFNLARIYGTKLEALLRLKLGEQRFRIAQDLASAVVSAVEQIASSPEVKARGEVKLAMANKRLDDMLRSKGIVYSAEQLETLIEDAVRTGNKFSGLSDPK